MGIFHVIDLNITYKIILGRPLLRLAKVVESIYYLKLKFKTRDGIDIVEEIKKRLKYTSQCH